MRRESRCPNCEIPTCRYEIADPCKRPDRRQRPRQFGDVNCKAAGPVRLASRVSRVQGPALKIANGGCRWHPRRSDLPADRDSRKLPGADPRRELHGRGYSAALGPSLAIARAEGAQTGSPCRICGECRRAAARALAGCRPPFPVQASASDRARLPPQGCAPIRQRPQCHLPPVPGLDSA